MNHYASRHFWARYEELPAKVRELADKNFELLKRDAKHLSLQSKPVGLSEHLIAQRARSSITR